MREREPLGSLRNPYPLPNVKNPVLPGDGTCDVVSLFHGMIRDMIVERDDVKAAIYAAPKIKNSMVLNDDGDAYRISDEKLVQYPYDRFLAELTARYGIDPSFRGRAKRLEPVLLGRLARNVEHIYGVKKVGDDYTILTLPRVEVIQMPDEKYYICRHTHAEFFDNPKGCLYAAGTFRVGFHDVRFNFRTGHLNIHFDLPARLAPVRLLLEEQFQFARDKTLPGRRRPEAAQRSLMLPYRDYVKASHDVEQEVVTKTPTLTRML